MSVEKKIEQTIKKIDRSISKSKVQNRKIDQKMKKLAPKIESIKKKVSSRRKGKESWTLESIREEIERLKKVEQRLFREKYEGCLVLGFKLILAKDGRGVTQLKAYKCIDGKGHYVYVGPDPENAEEKIRSYCEKKGINP